MVCYAFYNAETVTALLGCLLLLPAAARVAEEYQKHREETAPEPPKPEAMLPQPQGQQCFHMSREHCPTGTVRCARLDARSVFCCDVDSFRLKEGFTASAMGQNTSRLHILNATLDELDFSQAVYRRLTHLAVTDGRIGRIVGQNTSRLHILNATLDELDFSQAVYRRLTHLAVTDGRIDRIVGQNTSRLHILNATLDELDFSQAVYRRLTHLAVTDGRIGRIVGQNTSRLHILNATLDELDFSQAVYRRLTHLAVTDGRIGRIVGKFPKMSPLTCLNISNNQLTSAGLNASSRNLEFIMNLTVLDVSANNLTEFPNSLFSISRKIAVDLSGNNYTLCREYQKAMEGNSSQITFLNYNKTVCILSLTFNWFNESEFVYIDTIRIQKELNLSCRKIKPTPNCTCTRQRYNYFRKEVITAVSVECTNLNLKELPTNLPPNTVMLNVSYNNITSLAAVADEPSYDSLRQLDIDHNDVQSLLELEGTRFIDSFVSFSIRANKLKTIHSYVLSNTFDYSNQKMFYISKNRIHCDCNTEKVLKVWLLENSKSIPDLLGLECDNGMGRVVELIESRVCQQQRNWTDYIYYIIGAEVTTLVLLISKVSYDYWVFKTQGSLPWPANKMPRLPCDWLCE